MGNLCISMGLVAGMVDSVMFELHIVCEVVGLRVYRLGTMVFKKYIMWLFEIIWVKVGDLIG